MIQNDITKKLTITIWQSANRLLQPVPPCVIIDLERAYRNTINSLRDQIQGPDCGTLLYVDAKGYMIEPLYPHYLCS